MMTDWRELLGVEAGTASHREKWVSALGALVAIACIIYVNSHFVHVQAAQMVLAPMGASAVLLFAVPHGPLSQPWPLVVGHLISAAIGVTCARYIGDPLLAAGLAVGLSVSAMYYLRGIHPPGGASALIAVIGGPAIHELGYQYLLTPVLVNVAIILAVALLFNFPLAWRRYPASLCCRLKKKEAGETVQPIRHEDFVRALREMDSFVDVSEQDFRRIYALASILARGRAFEPAEILAGHAYSNGEEDGEWSVREIVDEQRSDDPEKDQVIYRVVAGVGRRDTAAVTRDAFARWARFEVVREDDGWQRVASAARV